MAARLRCPGEDGPEPREADVDQLSEHAYRRSGEARDLRKAGSLRPEAQHRGGERQSIFAHPQRASYEHHAGAWSQGLLHRIQFAEQEPQHAGLACGDDFEQQDFYLVDPEGEEQHRQRKLQRHSAGCCRGDAQQHRRVASREQHPELSPPPRHSRGDYEGIGLSV